MRQEIREISGMITTTPFSFGFHACCSHLMEVCARLRALDPSSLSHDDRALFSGYFRQMFNRYRSCKDHPGAVEFLEVMTRVIPLSVENVRDLSSYLASSHFQPSHPSDASQIVAALLQNLSYFGTFKASFDQESSAVVRAASEVMSHIQSFEDYIIEIPFDLLRVHGETNQCLPYLDHIFSLDIEALDSSMDPRAAAVYAVIEAASRDSDAWESVKNWLNQHSELVTDGLLAGGWHRHFKPDLCSKCTTLGLPWLAQAITQRSARVNANDFLELQLSQDIRPSAKVYKMAFENSAGQPKSAEETTLVALLAHALAFPSDMPETWSTKPNISALRLLHQAYRLVKEVGLTPDSARLESLFELCCSKLQQSNDVGWVDNTEFKNLGRNSIYFRSAKFNNELCL